MKCLTCYNDHLLKFPTTCHEDGIFGVAHHNMGIPAECVKQKGKGETTLITERCQVIYLTKGDKGALPYFQI
jgi:hypothetical protein